MNRRNFFSRMIGLAAAAVMPWRAVNANAHPWSFLRNGPRAEFLDRQDPSTCSHGAGQYCIRCMPRVENDPSEIPSDQYWPLAQGPLR